SRTPGWPLSLAKHKISCDFQARSSSLREGHHSTGETPRRGESQSRSEWPPSFRCTSRDRQCLPACCEVRGPHHDSHLSQGPLIGRQDHLLRIACGRPHLTQCHLEKKAGDEMAARQRCVLPD